MGKQVNCSQSIPGAASTSLQRRTIPNVKDRRNPRSPKDDKVVNKWPSGTLDSSLPHDRPRNHFETCMYIHWSNEQRYLISVGIPIVRNVNKGTVSAENNISMRRYSYRTLIQNSLKNIKPVTYRDLSWMLFNKDIKWLNRYIFVKKAAKLLRFLLALRRWRTNLADRIHNEFLDPSTDNKLVD